MKKLKNMRMKTALAFLFTVILGSQVLYAQEWAPDEVEAMADRAEKTVLKAYELLWMVNQRIDMADTVRDPRHTGVIGEEFSPLTTTMGYREAKDLSTMPGWAGWLVRNLTFHGIWKGADVAVAFSGSFPGLNIAVLAALQELGADVVGISSVGASSWGANVVGLSWPEMERLLREEGILKKTSGAVSIGGTGDRGAELSDYGLDLAMKAVKNSRLPFIDSINLRDSIKKRKLFYGSIGRYFCYINVGGNQASMGGGAHIRFDHGGWYFEPSETRGDPDGVMDAFLAMGVPCLNLLYLEGLNSRERIVNLEQH